MIHLGLVVVYWALALFFFALAYEGSPLYLIAAAFCEATGFIWLIIWIEEDSTW